MAVDYLGRPLAETDYFTGVHGIVAYVPIHGVHTIYARVGNLFAWLGIGALLVRPLVNRRSRPAR